MAPGLLRAGGLQSVGRSAVRRGDQALRSSRASVPHGAGCKEKPNELVESVALALEGQ